MNICRDGLRLGGVLLYGQWKPSVENGTRFGRLMQHRGGAVDPATRYGDCHYSPWEGKKQRN